MGGRKEVKEGGRKKGRKEGRGKKVLQQTLGQKLSLSRQNGDGVFTSERHIIIILYEVIRCGFPICQG